MVVAQRNCLHSPGKPVDSPDEPRFIFCLFIDLYCKFVILILYLQQQCRHILIHLLEGVMYLLLRPGLVQPSVHKPRNGSS